AIGKLFDLATVHEKFAGPLWNMVQLVGLDVFRDVAAHEPDFIAFDSRVGILKRDSASAEAFHFAAHKDDAAFQSFKHLIFVAGAAILRDEALVVVLSVGCGAFLAALVAGFLRFGHIGNDRIHAVHGDGPDFYIR